MKPESITDYELTVKLLGRKPRTPFKVKTKCPDGTPQTIIADPVFLEDGLYKPFPTFIWLVCPRLKALVGTLEQKGMVKEFSDKLKTDKGFKDLYLAGHEEMAKIRLALAKEIYKEALNESLPEHIEEILTVNTIAGSKDVLGVKCLHSHLAQELAYGNNPIGAEVLGLVGHCEEKHNCGIDFIKEIKAEKAASNVKEAKND